MSSEPLRFHESNLWSTPIRDLGLTIEGTRLEPILGEFEDELRRAGITRVRPRFYLSSEWGVPFGTVAIAIPFYLAQPDLTALHAERVGHVEGFDRTDILRYLRHEMGHVTNYAYRLYDDEEWSETFAVWMTPGLDWRAEYGAWPIAYAKLAYCSRAMTALQERDPEVTSSDLEEDVGDIEYSLDQYYGRTAGSPSELLPGLDGALRAIFEDLGGSEGLSLDDPLRPASNLIRRLEPELMANVFRWTGRIPPSSPSLPW